jgi:hypothetical protein
VKWGVLALLWLAPCAQAEDWVEAATTSDGDVHYYAGDKLHIEGDGVAYWRKVEFRMPLPVQAALAQSALYREHIDCAELRLRTLGYLYYAADGAIIENVYVPDAPPVAIRQGTPAERLASALCPMVAEASAAAAAEPVDELDKLRREVEALQTQVHRLRRGLQVQEAAGTGR